MNSQMVIDLAQRCLQIVVLLSAPVLLAGMLVGLLVSLLQAVTSVQEATLTFVPKLVAVFAVFLLCLPWMLDLLIGFSAELFGNLGRFAR